MVQNEFQSIFHADDLMTILFIIIKKIDAGLWNNICCSMPGCVEGNTEGLFLLQPFPVYSEASSISLKASLSAY